MSLFLERLSLKTSLVLVCLSNAACAVTPHGFETVTGFEELPVVYEHEWDETVHPFSGAAVIDVDGDGRMEVFIGGGNQQADALLSYRNGQLQNVIEGRGLSSLTATYGSVSIDMDNDDDVDLVVARDSGLFLYLNQSGKFVERQIPLALASNAVPFAVAVSDIDQDGDADLYISVFVDYPSFRSAVYNDPEHAKSNILLMNNGDLTFTDITASSNTAGMQNTFLSVFTDLDGDGWQDLVLSQNTGEIEFFRNNQDRSFTAIPSNSGYGFWMGLALGDIDGDGDQDLFFSNVGGSIPAFLTRGDIRDDQRHNLEWLLLRNDGDFSFTDVTQEFGLTGEGFAWGAVFEDLNLDGQLDLLVAQNYIKWPIHKLFKLSGRSYLQIASGGKFAQVDELALDNSHFGQSPLSVDLDADGRPDILWVNMNGPVKAALNRTPGRSFLVAVPEQVSLLGTRVKLLTSKGESYTREVATGIGMLTDQTPNLVFGLGDHEKVLQVVITRPDGSVETIDNPGSGYQLAP